MIVTNSFEVNTGDAGWSRFGDRHIRHCADWIIFAIINDKLSFQFRDISRWQ
ncbi:hypothetical protein THIOM_000467 [Candidatus Thiomargarita nelsonii]|uniref:Uncharacterized protein n=1 Tax=Candidatus Thiomargarita nelsonii TaxID=1003181 RepID=A0A176S6J4_9GAMM|nr:hypothetical protein THIOM_000467 [Candidatus Thiomargarita nelsonii]